MDEHEDELRIQACLLSYFHHLEQQPTKGQTAGRIGAPARLDPKTNRANRREPKPEPKKVAPEPEPKARSKSNSNRPCPPTAVNFAATAIHRAYLPRPKSTHRIVTADIKIKNVSIPANIVYPNQLKPSFHHVPVSMVAKERKQGVSSYHESLT